ncbi:MAG TPA: fibronectin type III domain-containing protein [Candidatus Paceibacterota bacterium]
MTSFPYKKSIIAFALSISLGVLMHPENGFGITPTSSSYTVHNPVITSGFASMASGNFGLGQSFGQSVIGKSLSSSFAVWSGFQYFASAGTFTLSGVGGSSQAQLSWTIPEVFNGAVISGYEVGIGTTSGSYTFQDVGNVTSFTKTGLNNNTPYYFLVKAHTASGAPLSFSNEVSITPTGTITPPGGGGGGGGGGSSTGTGSVIVSGIAYPGATVVILKDGKIETQTTADPGGAFNVLLSSLRATHYAIGVYAEDTAGRKSPPYSFPVTLADQVTITIANVFLAPTIGVDKSVVAQGEPIGIFGSSAPNTQVNIYVHSAQEFVEKVTSTTTGAWFKQFDTTFLEIGDHSTFSRAVLSDQVTNTSVTVPFVVGTTSVPIETLGRSDLNNDGRVNITDFSMLLYYWQGTPPPGSKVDIIKDGIVNSTDLSIMLYDWTG